MILTPGGERKLDDLLRAELVVDPPPYVSLRLRELLKPRMPATIVADSARSPADSALVARTGPRSPSAVTYALVALVLSAYATLVSAIGLDSVLGVVVESWRSAQLVAQSPAGLVVASAAAVLPEYLAWLALIPLAWFLWESDRRDSRRTSTRSV